MEKAVHSSWPTPPERIAKAWPDGFPAEDSEEFNRLASNWGAWGCESISRYLERELSTIDKKEIYGHARDILREYFSGSYDLGPFEEMYARYFLGVFGYVPEEVFRKLQGTAEQVSRTARDLFHRLHAKAHHE